jgi:hypothetical protein
MDLGAVLLLLGVVFSVILFIIQPFTKNWRVRTQSSQAVSGLLTERERTLIDLLDLDFDKEIGKIPAEEYSIRRAILIQKGSDILRKLDEVQAEESSSRKKLLDKKADEKHTSLLSDEDLEDLIAKRRQTRQQKTAGFCPNCGKPIFKLDQFCPSCGLKLFRDKS